MRKTSANFDSFGKRCKGCAYSKVFALLAKVIEIKGGALALCILDSPTGRRMKMFVVGRSSSAVTSVAVKVLTSELKVKVYRKW